MTERQAVFYLPKTITTTMSKETMKTYCVTRNSML